jgi:hypothetical protein
MTLAPKDERLREGLALDAIDERGEQQSDQDAARGPHDEPQHVVAEGHEHVGIGEREAVVVRRTAVLSKARDDRADRRVDERESEQCDGRADEHERADPLGEPPEQVDDAVRRDEQRPDAAHAEDEGEDGDDRLRRSRR